MDGWMGPYTDRARDVGNLGTEMMCGAKGDIPHATLSLSLFALVQVDARVRRDVPR